MNVINKMSRKASLLAVTALAAAPGLASASGGTDFSGILSGVSGATAVTAVISAAGILALVGFAVWGGKKVARFFG